VTRKEPYLGAPNGDLPSLHPEPPIVVPTMVQLMPIRAYANVILPFASVPVNIVAWFASWVIPEDFRALGRLVAGPTSAFVNHLAQGGGGGRDMELRSAIGDEHLIRDLVLSIDLPLIAISAVLCILNLLSYRKYIGASIRSRHGASAEEWYGQHGDVAVLMVVGALFAILELVFGGVSFQYFEHLVRGKTVSFTNFVMRLSIYCVMVSSLLTFGLSVLLARALARIYGEEAPQP